MDGCRPVSRPRVPSPTEHAAQMGELARTRRPGPKPTPAGAAESGGRGLIDDAQGTGPIFSGREWASRQRKVAEPRHLMRVCNQPAPRTACSAVAPHAATH